ncbi:Uncharacterized [Syntrophomonas zehnderi OL-4]|uniref:Uncharacterized n=1 Tax=Syntrophomonas zehnderi OL-4 TaxID=690567 RepID=A0A0E4GCV2_9FIRM|nr:hypothetical protein [Syntrophomonas zehnderi]CFY07345.1 Uncharacterized [Syntrophomonas zehnderi OL-4]
MTNNTTTRKPIKFKVNVEKEFNQSKAPNEEKSSDRNGQPNVMTEEEKKMMNDYLNEKLFYFYNNGGPIMDL